MFINMAISPVLQASQQVEGTCLQRGWVGGNGIEKEFPGVKAQETLEFIWEVTDLALCGVKQPVEWSEGRRRPATMLWGVHACVNVSLSSSSAMWLGKAWNWPSTLTHIFVKSKSWRAPIFWELTPDNTQTDIPVRSQPNMGSAGVCNEAGVTAYTRWIPTSCPIPCHAGDTVY